MERPRTVALLTSDEVGWIGVRTTLQSLPGVCVLGEARDAGQLHRLLAHQIPDVLLAATVIAGHSTLPLLAGVRRRRSAATKILLFATRVEPADLRACAALGVAGYLIWDELSCADLRRSLETVLTTDLVVSCPALARAFLAASGEGAADTRLDRLTEHEQLVLGLLVGGRTHKAIAKATGLSLRTVERIVTRLEDEFDVSSAGELIWTVARLGFTP